jgi:hypothetical protein
VSIDEELGDASSNVFHLRSSNKREFVVLRGYDECRHPEKIFDTESRLVWCGKCRKLLDAFAVLEETVSSFAERSKMHSKLREEVTALSKRRDALDRLCRNYNDRLKRRGLAVEHNANGCYRPSAVAVTYDKFRQLAILETAAGTEELTFDDAESTWVALGNVVRNMRNDQRVDVPRYEEKREP